MARKIRDFVTQTEQLLRLMTAKRLNVREGKQACTDGKSTVYLPPLPEDATEEDKIGYLGTGIHEGSHHEGKSEPWKMDRDSTIHFLQNAVDDIRCEHEQEKEYHGLVHIRRDWYKVMYKKFWAEKMPRVDKRDLKQFVQAMGCYMIFKVRDEQIEAELKIEASEELVKAYDAYFADLEPEIKAATKFEQALELGKKLYERVKDMIKEELAKRTPPPPKPPKKEKKDDKKDKSEDTEGSEAPEEKGSSEDPTPKSEESEAPESKGEPSEGAEEESPDKSDATEDSETEETDSGDDSDAAGEGTGSDSDSEDTEATGEGAEGEVGSDKTPDGAYDPGDDSEKGRVPPMEPTDRGGNASDKESGMEDVSDGGLTDEDTKVDEGDPDTEDSEGTEAKEDAAEDPDGEDPDSEMDRGTDDTGAEESDTPDPVDAKYDEELDQWKLKIEEGVEEELDDLKKHPELKDIADMMKEFINRFMESIEGPYCVDPKIKDHIEYNREGDDYEVNAIHENGLRYLGAAGSKLTRVFVSQSRERTIYNQHEGRIDLPAVISDVFDNRMDLFNQTRPGSIDKAAVSFMIDNSGSMRGVADKVYSILDAFLFYLGRARIPTEAVGFTCGTPGCGAYRDIPVNLTIVKKFEEPYSRTVARRCVPPSYMDQNCEVDCLKYMVPRLFVRPEGKKILIVLGDGEPYNGHAVLQMKLKRAYKQYLQDCRDAGIIVFGFGIGCDLSEYFLEDFVSVDSDDMGAVVLKKLTEIINRKKRS